MNNNPERVFSNDMQHIIGDSAFELSMHMLVPYRGTNLNRRQIKFNTVLSKTRVVIENAFGLLKGRFRRLKYIDSNLENIPLIIQCACILHNFTLQYIIDEQEFLNDITQEQPEEYQLDLEINLPDNTDGVNKKDLISFLL